MEKYRKLWKTLVPETRVFQAADGEDLVILACTVFDWSTPVTDGQTDRRTDRIAMAKTQLVAIFTDTPNFRRRKLHVLKISITS